MRWIRDQMTLEYALDTGSDDVGVCVGWARSDRMVLG
jgi:hypothetical protein